MVTANGCNIPCLGCHVCLISNDDKIRKLRVNVDKSAEDGVGKDPSTDERVFTCIVQLRRTYFLGKKKYLT